MLRGQTRIGSSALVKNFVEKTDPPRGLKTWVNISKVSEGDVGLLRRLVEEDYELEQFAEECNWL